MFARIRENRVAFAIAFAFTSIFTQPGLAQETVTTPQAHAEWNPSSLCNQRLFPIGAAPLTRLEAQGVHGRPYREPSPSGCECGKPLGLTRCPNASNYWPRPLSAKLGQNHPRLACSLTNQVVPAINAPFDRLQGYSGVSSYRRSDNGYCGDGVGRGQDAYGCVGETRAKYGIYGSSAGVVGLGIRNPGSPIQR